MDTGALFISTRIFVLITTLFQEKTEFEGSLFVYNRTGKAVEVAFLIMNRLNKENLLVVVKSGMEFKPQEPFLLCRTATGKSPKLLMD